MTNSAAVPVAETLASQKPASPAPNQGVSFLATFDAVKAILKKYPSPKRPYRTKPLDRNDEAEWAEIDKTAPSRADLEKLRSHFRSQ